MQASNKKYKELGLENTEHDIDIKICYFHTKTIERIKMKDEINLLCNELDKIQIELNSDNIDNKREIELKKESYTLDEKLRTILHTNIDPLIKDRWKMRIILYKDKNNVKRQFYRWKLLKSFCR